LARASQTDGITKDIKDYVIKGNMCKLYKEDGSRSELHMYMTPDLMEINCKLEKDKQVKAKWRMSVNHINNIVSN